MTNTRSTSPIPWNLLQDSRSIITLKESYQDCEVHKSLLALQVCTHIYITMDKVSIGACTHVSGGSSSVPWVLNITVHHVISRRRCLSSLIAT